MPARRWPWPGCRAIPRPRSWSWRNSRSDLPAVGARAEVIAAAEGLAEMIGVGEASLGREVFERGGGLTQAPADLGQPDIQNVGRGGQAGGGAETVTEVTPGQMEFPGNLLDAKGPGEVVLHKPPHLPQHRLPPIARMREVVPVALEVQHPIEQGAFLGERVGKTSLAVALKEGETLGGKRGFRRQGKDRRVAPGQP